MIHLVIELRTSFGGQRRGEEVGKRTADRLECDSNYNYSKNCDTKNENSDSTHKTEYEAEALSPTQRGRTARTKRKRSPHKELF